MVQWTSGLTPHATGAPAPRTTIRSTKGWGPPECTVTPSEPAQQMWSPGVQGPHLSWNPMGPPPKAPEWTSQSSVQCSQAKWEEWKAPSGSTRPLPGQHFSVQGQVPST